MTAFFIVNNQDHPSASDNMGEQDGVSAQKIPPRLADRLGIHDFNRPGDNLPALKNQLQMVMEMMQQAMEKNLAAERRRMQRTMWTFVLALACLVLTVMAGAGWFVLQMQTRMEHLLIEMARPAPAVARPEPTPAVPMSEPSPVPPPPAAPQPETALTTAQPASPPAPAPAPGPSVAADPPAAAEEPDAPPDDDADSVLHADLDILQTLQADLMAVDEKSRALDELIAAQNIRLQDIMREVMLMDTDAQSAPAPAVTPDEEPLSRIINTLPAAAEEPAP